MAAMQPVPQWAVIETARGGRLQCWGPFTTQDAAEDFTRQHDQAVHGGIRPDWRLVLIRPGSDPTRSPLTCLHPAELLS